MEYCFTTLGEKVHTALFRGYLDDSTVNWKRNGAGLWAALYDDGRDWRVLTEWNDGNPHVFGATACFAGCPTWSMHCRGQLEVALGPIQAQEMFRWLRFNLRFTGPEIPFRGMNIRSTTHSFSVEWSGTIDKFEGTEMIAYPDGTPAYKGRFWGGVITVSQRLFMPPNPW